MAVDKNLFLHDLAVVAMLYNEGRYLKELVDYHLLAGVDHFYIYDHESTDNTKEILQPYVDAGLVTYIFYPGQNVHMKAYNEAIAKYKFFCRYMAFIDGDEFIFPLKNCGIADVVDELLAFNPNIGGVQIRWRFFGSNYHDKADYSRGVLERFTRRGEVQRSVKTIANPRRVHYMTTPHYMFYYENIIHISDYSFGDAPNMKNYVSDRIVINHYYTKSREEFEMKSRRGSAVHTKNIYVKKHFDEHDHNDIFDDSILKYRDSRLQEFVPNGGNFLQTMAARKSADNDRIAAALVKNVSPLFSGNVSADFFKGKLELFMTCLAVTSYLKKFSDDLDKLNLIEETLLKAIYLSLVDDATIAESQLFICELPNILKLKYPVVKDLREVSVPIIKNIKDHLRLNITDPRMDNLMLWQDIVYWDYIERLLKII